MQCSAMQGYLYVCVLDILGAEEDVEDWFEHCSLQGAYTNDRRGNNRVFQALGQQWGKRYISLYNVKEYFGQF